MAHLLKLSDDAVCDAGNRLGQQTLHQGLEYVHFMLDAEVDEVCVNEHVVRWAQLRVMLEKETHLLLLHLFDLDVVEVGEFLLACGTVLGPLILLDLLATVVHFQTGIVRVDHALHCGELPCLVCFAHFCLVCFIKITPLL